MSLLQPTFVDFARMQALRWKSGERLLAGLFGRGNCLKRHAMAAADKDSVYEVGYTDEGNFGVLTSHPPSGIDKRPTVLFN